MDLDLSSLIEKLPDHYAVMYKMHPLLRDVDLGSGERILNVTDEEAESSIYGSRLPDYGLLFYFV